MPICSMSDACGTWRLRYHDRMWTGLDAVRPRRGPAGRLWVAVRGFDMDGARRALYHLLVLLLLYSTLPAVRTSTRALSPSDLLFLETRAFAPLRTPLVPFCPWPSRRSSSPSSDPSFSSSHSAFLNPHPGPTGLSSIPSRCCPLVAVGVPSQPPYNIAITLPSGSGPWSTTLLVTSHPRPMAPP